MTKQRSTVGFALLLALAFAGQAWAQGTTGSLSGRVSDADGNAVPGVAVSLTSSALQGTKTTVTDASGEYFVPSLPPGDYTVTFALEGMETQTRRLTLSAAQLSRADVDMSITGLTETIEVIGETEQAISESITTQVTVSQKSMELLPTNRTLLAAAQGVAGVTATGPNNALVISGAQSWENSYSINGVNVEDNIRRTPNSLFIEDAIEEVTTSTAGISAEYGRFSGGMVNAVTKSGGNEFHGSFRDNLTNQDWNSENRFSPTAIDDIQEIYEATLGGRVIRDHLWFFGAGRSYDLEEQRTTNILNLPWARVDGQDRYEAKLTASPTSNHRLTGDYIWVDQTQTTHHGGLTQYAVDLSSINVRNLPNDLLSFNYTGTLTSNFFVEGQYSERSFEFEPHGGTDPSFPGTLIWDLANGVTYNGSLFCGICPDGGDVRENEDYFAKANYFLSTDSAGSHELVLGYDVFSDIRLSNNYQSSNNYITNVDDSLFVNNVPYPIVIPYSFGGASYIQYSPIVTVSLGTDFETHSIFVNDRWRLNDHWNFNLGVRYDKNDGTDAEGKTVVAKDSEISPRLGVSWMPGDGTWVFNASYGRYVSGLANGIAGDYTSAGQPGFIGWFYDGPAFNNPGQPLVSSRDVNRAIYNWFDSVGGLNNTSYLFAFSIPGGSNRISDSLTSTSADEAVLGFSRNFGGKGSVRADLVYREYNNFYADFTDLSTGKVRNNNGNLVDLIEVRNNDSLLNREYIGLQTSVNFKALDSLTLGGSYTLSEATGNLDGETGGSGPITANLTQYPEYKQARWNAPEGNLSIDQTHKLGVYGLWEAFASERQNVTVGLVQRFLSGRPYSAIGSVRSRTFVTNPGYVTPPSTVSYFFSDRGEFETDDITATDASLNYAFNVGPAELFAQVDVINVFNEDGQVNCGGTCLTVLTNTNTSSLQTFNPFTQTPVEGVHWRKGPNFGKPTAVADLQTPRTYTVSVGFRF